MSFNLDLEPGEQVIANLLFVPSKNQEAFRIAVTDRVVVLLRKQFFAKTDAFYAQRVPFKDVLEVRIAKVAPYGMWILSTLMVLIGGLTTYSMFDFANTGSGRSLSGYPPAILIVGLLVPFLIRNRYGISVKLDDETYRWKPPVMVDRDSKAQVTALLNELATAAVAAHLRFTDERPPMESEQVPTTRKRNYPVAELWSEGAKGNCRPCFHCRQSLAIPK